jgi:arylsulfatase
VFYPPVGHINSDVAPVLGNRSFTVTAEIERPSERTEGCLFAYGAATSGLSLYVLGDQLVFDYNLFGRHYKAASQRKLPVGKLNAGVAFERLGKIGRATVLVNGQPGGSIEVPFVMRMISLLGMEIGHDPGSSVSNDYRPPFAFQGTIRRLIFEVVERSSTGEAQAQRSEIATELARQ